MATEPLVPGDPWTEQACPVEGCRYCETEHDGCGLNRVGIGAAASVALWDAKDPIVHGCLAARRAEHFAAEAGWT